MRTSASLKALTRINVPRTICEHLVGERHTAGHRMIVGFVIMAGGVLVAKGAHHVPFFAGQAFFDLIGYGIHGIGAAPYVELVLHAAQEQE